MKSVVTVVIPLFNKRAWIDRAIDSVLRQTWRDIELIVVDDGSEDGGADAVAARRDTRIRVIRQANQGPGAARNAGWRLGAGELVAFLDADDYWEPAFIEWGVATLIGDRSLAACTSACREIRTGGGIVDTRAEWPASGVREGPVKITANSPMRELSAVLTYMSPVSTIARRSILEKFDGFYSREHCSYGEDSFLWLKVLLNHRVYVSLRPLVVVDRTASALSKLDTLATRSLEPLLTSADEIRSFCPVPLQTLLSRLLADRAFKRACTLAAVGQWRRAADLRQTFMVPRSWLVRYGFVSLLLSNPFGARTANLLLRILRRVSATR